jgi:hypothetical protein
MSVGATVVLYDVDDHTLRDYTCRMLKLVCKLNARGKGRSQYYIRM